MATESIAIQAGELPTRPYAPGWLDMAGSWIHSRPWPAWLTFLVIGAISVVISNAQNWRSGGPSAVTFTQTAWGIVTVAFFVLRDYFSRLAGEAFDDFRPALSPGQVDEARFRYELTTEPRLISLVVLVVSFPLTFAFYGADPVGSQVVGLGTAALLLRGAFEATFSAILLSLLIQSLRQMRLVSRLHAVADRIDPFQPVPLHAFSRLTSRTGMALIAVIVLGVTLNPDAIRSEAIAFWLPWLVGFPIVAILIFVAPLLGMHRRLGAAKAALQAAADQRLKVVIAAVHTDVDAMDLVRADGLQKTLGSIVQEREILARLPTWPWSTGTVRGFATAILLPIAIFLIQRTLSQVV